MEVKKYTSEYSPLVGSFSCGNFIIDNFLKSNDALDIGQGITYILLSDNEAVIIGFYNIEAGRIDYIEGSVGQPIYRPMGGSANINFLAIDKRYQRTEIANIDGKKIYLGDYLLNDCENRIKEIRNQIGLSFITLNSTEEGHYLYMRNGYEHFEDDMSVTVKEKDAGCYKMYKCLDNEDSSDI